MECLSPFAPELDTFDDCIFPPTEAYSLFDQSALLNFHHLPFSQEYQYDELGTLEGLRYMFEENPYSSSASFVQPQSSTPQVLYAQATATTSVDGFGLGCIGFDGWEIPGGFVPVPPADMSRDTTMNQTIYNTSASTTQSMQLGDANSSIISQPHSGQFPPFMSAMDCQPKTTSMPPILDIVPLAPQQIKLKNIEKSITTKRKPESPSSIIVRSPKASKHAGTSDTLTKHTPSPTTTLRPTKKLRGPPSALLGVFDANTDPNQKRNRRKTFSDESKKKVEAVRTVGACIQCRFRKRPVRTYDPTLGFQRQS